MSLTDTINNTNTQKDNLKTVANNIDNKLVELGGEQAINLADVPNKIEKTINEYSKIATIKTNVNFKKTGNITINYNIDFTPDFAIISLKRLSNALDIKNSFDTRDGECYIYYDFDREFYHLKFISISNKSLVLRNTVEYALMQINKVTLVKL